MEVALQEIIKYGGKHEKSIDSRVRQYHKEGSGLTAGSGTAWCASFVNWCIKETNQFSYRKTAGSVSISQYGEYKKIDKPIFGALVVFKNYKQSNNSACGHGHVSFLFGKTDKGKLICLGGNQGNRIKLSSYSETGVSNSFCGDEHGCVNQKFYGYYIPKDYEIKQSDYLTDNDIYNQPIDVLNNKLLKTETKTEKNESTF